MFRVPKLGMLLIGLAVVGTGCDQVPTDGDPADETAPVLHHRPGHAGGGPGTGEDPPGYTLEFSGAVVAGPTAVEVGRDNRKALHVSGTMNIDFAFNVGASSCTITLPDGYGGSESDLRAYFENVLGSSNSDRDVEPLGVEKGDETGSIRFLPLVEGGDDPWVRLGGATVSGNFDGPGDRVLTFTGGSVRVVARLRPDTWEVCSSTVPCKASYDLADYVCSDWGSVVATLRESQ